MGTREQCEGYTCLCEVLSEIIYSLSWLRVEVVRWGQPIFELSIREFIINLLRDL
eukprot:SAG11_NODE_41374_length_194_cov_224.684211_1_plen_54_part_01